MNLKLTLFALMVILSATISAQMKNKTGQKKTVEITFSVGMHCQSCKDRIEKNIPMEKGVKDLKVDLDKKEVTVVYNPVKTTVEKLKKAFQDLGYTCEELKPEKE